MKSIACLAACALTLTACGTADWGAGTNASPYQAEFGATCGNGYELLCGRIGAVRSGTSTSFTLELAQDMNSPYLLKGASDAQIAALQDFVKNHNPSSYTGAALICAKLTRVPHDRPTVQGEYTLGMARIVAKTGNNVCGLR